MPQQTFSIHPDNHRCFIYKGRPFKILTSAEHYGAVLNGDFDYDIYLEEMTRTGQNMTRLFTFYRETESSIPAPGNMNTLAPSPEASILPWERVSGHGQAADGLDKFDLDRWNEAYFDRLRDFVQKCDDAGIVCEITLFCNPYQMERLDRFPCGEPSNINGVGGDCPSTHAFMTLQAPTIVAFQERFIRKVVTELNPYDNIYYEICNEPHGPPVPKGETKVIAWHRHLARVIREVEDDLPKRHLIAANAHYNVETPHFMGLPTTRHEDLAYFEDPCIDIVNYHYISRKAVDRGLRFYSPPDKEAHAGLIWHFLRARDIYRKPLVFDETFSGIVGGSPERYAVNRAEAWEMVLSGGAGYNNLDWTFTPADETGAGVVPIADGRSLDGRSLREWIAILHELLSGYDLATLVPATDLVDTDIPGVGHAASQDGPGRMVVYLVDDDLYTGKAFESRQVSVSLTLPPGAYGLRLLDPRTGNLSEGPGLESTGDPVSVDVELNGDVAVLLDPAPDSQP